MINSLSNNEIVNYDKESQATEMWNIQSVMILWYYTLA